MSEVRLPKEEWEARFWQGFEDLHPFWLIRRDTKTDKHNCEMRVQVLKQCSILDFKDLPDSVGGHAFRIQYPFIVNHKLIKKGDEVVLKWAETPVTPVKTTRPLSDQLHHIEVKRQKKVL